MRFLVIFKKNASPQEPFSEHIKKVKTLPDYFNSLKREGKAREWGFFAGQHAGFVILEAESLKEMSLLVDKMPVMDVCETEVLPVIDEGEWEEIIKKIAE
jgi:muconolactone delta-isomerase